MIGGGGGGRRGRRGHGGLARTVVVHSRIHCLLLLACPGHFLLVVGLVVSRSACQAGGDLHDVRSRRLDNLLVCQVWILLTVLPLLGETSEKALDRGVDDRNDDCFGPPDIDSLEMQLYYTK